MTKLEKIYWKIHNPIQALIGRLRGNPGLLTHRKDIRDRLSEFGAVFGLYSPKHKELSHFRYQFRQRDNICTAAGVALALSEQTGVRWSTKALMRMMKKQGKVSGNGFSYQRAPMDVVVNFGLIPYDLMPDENDRGWDEYSRWDEYTERLYKDVAPRFKFSEYKKLSNEGSILEALDKGFVPVTASGWYADMNRPRAPLFLLKFLGRYIGGHQYRVTGYKNSGEYFETPQTFGEHYGDHGKAYSETLFGKGYNENYYLEYNGQPLLPTEILLPVFLRQNEGKMVRTQDDMACYVIENGAKRWVSGEDNMRTFGLLYDKVGLTYVKKELLAAVPQGENYPLT